MTFAVKAVIISVIGLAAGIMTFSPVMAIEASRYEFAEMTGPRDARTDSNVASMPMTSPHRIALQQDPQDSESPDASAAELSALSRWLIWLVLIVLGGAAGLWWLREARLAAKMVIDRLTADEPESEHPEGLEPPSS